MKRSIVKSRTFVCLDSNLTFQKLSKFDVQAQIGPKTHRNLHGATNFLILLISLSDILHGSSYLLFLGVVLSGSNFIPLRMAFAAQFHSIFGFNATIMLIALVAIDRLFAVLSPE